MSTKTNPHIGIITIACGKEKYYKQALNLAISIKVNMPSLPISLITDREEIDDKYFDNKIAINSSYGIGVVQKIFIDEYTPYEETLFLDSDCIVCKDFSEQLENIRGFDFSPVCSTYLTKNQSDDYIDNLEMTLSKLNSNTLPKFNGGLYYFKKKSTLSKKVFKIAKEFLVNYKSYGVKNFDAAGPNEETIFSLSLAQLGINKLYDDKGFFMQTTNNIKDFSISPIDGNCSFIKNGIHVQPAICHFIRSNTYNHHYLRCELILKKHVGELNSIVKLLTSYTNYIRYTSIYLLKKLYFILLHKHRSNN
ncbi:hypothetical protein PQO01_18275 [Lentisphaera marina]|uniref:hypothetical protein n=1 Tax=Lentisphaera marina TaxID=1111041 RepID=UPI002366360E|nr:hypothetical protein [Lentisphaera marina]MDD7986899.1 hypothetical protein [Lentisphaera marina]